MTEVLNFHGIINTKSIIELRILKHFMSLFMAIDILFKTVSVSFTSIESILELSGRRAVIVGIANIKGGGGEIARYFGNRAEELEPL